MVVSQEELTATGDATASKKRKTSGGCRPKDDGFGPIWVGVSGGGGGREAAELDADATYLRVSS